MAGKPKYLQVADILRREIAEGIFRDGDKLTTEEELRFRFRVSRQTVRQAIAQLEDDGLVDRRRGSGTYVRHGPRKRQGLLRIGMLTSYITDYISPEILSGVEKTLNENSAVMVLSATQNDPALERSLMERLLDGQVDGLIVEGCRTAEPTPNADCFLRLAERNIPVLFMNAFYRELDSVPHLVMDDYGGGRPAAEELVHRGYKKLAGVFKMDDLQGVERARGFREALTDLGMPFSEDSLLTFDTEERMELFRSVKGEAFLQRLAAKEFDGLVCYNDIFASPVIEALENLGVNLPEDLGIISFDNAQVSALCRPALTTLAHPKERFGARAAEKMLRMLEGEKEGNESMKWTLIERDSAPVRKNG